MTLRSSTRGQLLPPVKWEPLAGVEVIVPQSVLEENLALLEWEKVVREVADTVPAELDE